MLDSATVNVKNCDQLLYIGILVEELDDQSDTAKYKLSKALQLCPESGILWTKAISFESSVRQV